MNRQLAALAFAGLTLNGQTSGAQISGRAWAQRHRDANCSGNLTMSAIRLTNSRQGFEFLKNRFSPHQEEFWAVALDNELRVLNHSMIFRGTINSCNLHPRELFRFLFVNGASSFMVGHNHPTGRPLPSRADMQITRQIWKLSHWCMIPLNDHLIFAEGTYCSLADRGFFTKMSVRI